MAAEAWKHLTNDQLAVADRLLDAAVTHDRNPNGLLAASDASDEDKAAIAAALAPDRPLPPEIAREAALDRAQQAIDWATEFPGDPIYEANAWGAVRQVIDHDIDEA